MAQLGKYNERKKWTRKEYETVLSLGILNDQPLELIDGDMVDKARDSASHAVAKTRFAAILGAIFGSEFVQQGAPIDVAPEDNPVSEPRPDILVVTRSGLEIRKRNPRPEDLRLVIEVAEDTLAFDLRNKADLYARAGIPDYWVLDVAGCRMIVFRDPSEGNYQSVIAYNSEEGVAPLAAPDSAIRTDALLF